MSHFITKTDKFGDKRKHCIVSGCLQTYHINISTTILTRHFHNKHVHQPGLNQSVLYSKTDTNKGMQEVLASCFAALNLPLRAVEKVIIHSSQFIFLFIYLFFCLCIYYVIQPEFIELVALLRNTQCNMPKHRLLRKRTLSVAANYRTK
jgi:hypothetical protein